MDAATHSRKTPLHSSLRYRLISFLGPEHVHAASAPDMVAGVQPKLVVIPGSESELAEALRLVSEDQAARFEPSECALLQRPDLGEAITEAGPP